MNNTDFTKLKQNFNKFITEQEEATQPTNASADVALNDIPMDAPGSKQLHVFDFDDTLGITDNLNGVLHLQDGVPVHKTEQEVRDWLSKYGVTDAEIRNIKVKVLPGQPQAFAAYIDSDNLAKITGKVAARGISPGPPKPGDSIYIDFTPSSMVNTDTTKPIEPTIDRMKKAKSLGSKVAVVTARKGKDTPDSPPGISFTGEKVTASNQDDMTNFLSKKGIKPDTVMGVTGGNKGNIIDKNWMQDPQTKPAEVHFYDDAAQNTDQVSAALGDKEDSEVYIYGPGRDWSSQLSNAKKLGAAKKKQAVAENKKNIKLNELRTIIKKIIKEQLKKR